MTDQCKHCTLRGDIKKCKAAECFHHENWYAVQQQSEIDMLKQQRDELLAALKDASEIISDIHSDPEVLNAYKVHYDNDDILRAEAAIKNAEGE